jgi:hypothetical protein
MKMKKTAAAFTILACVAACLAAEEHHKAYMFALTNFGMLIPSGFSRDNRPGSPPDFKVWVFTNAAGSRLSFMVGGHWNPTGTKTDFKGFAALEYKTNLVRQIAFDSAGFSHSELKKSGRPPDYDARLEYRATNAEDGKTMDESIDSFFVNKKRESNHTPDDVRQPADGSPKPSV